MGFGGVTALGCTIGQGLSGVSTLALGLVSGGRRDRRRLRGGAQVPDVAVDRASPRSRREPMARAALMIIFDLTCTHGHRFEGWFASADDFERQAKAVMVRCPVCDDASVVRVPSAKVHVGRATVDAPRGAEEPEDRRPPRACPPSSCASCARSCATPRTSAAASRRKRARSTTRKCRRGRSAARRRRTKPTRCARKASISRRCRRSSRATTTDAMRRFATSRAPAVIG